MNKANQPTTEDGLLNYNFNPMMQIKAYIEAIYADIEKNLESKGVILNKEESRIDDVSSCNDHSWKLNFYPDSSSNKFFVVKYIHDSGWEDSSWPLSNDPLDQKVRFPKVECQFWSEKGSLFRFNIHSHVLNHESFLEMVSFFLLCNKRISKKIKGKN
jgi:hypothetical protein